MHGKKNDSFSTLRRQFEKRELKKEERIKRYKIKR